MIKPQRQIAADALALKNSIAALGLAYPFVEQWVCYKSMNFTEAVGSSSTHVGQN